MVYLLTSFNATNIVQKVLFFHPDENGEFLANLQHPVAQLNEETL